MNLKTAFSTLVFIGTSMVSVAFAARSLTHEAQLYGRARQINERVLKNCRNCSFAESPSADPVCRDKYDQIYKKPEVNVHVAIGYMDDSENPNGGWYGGVQLRPNEAIDGLAQEGLLHHLTLPCRSGGGACGFQRHSVDQTLVFKTIEYRGQSTRINVRITNSAATPILAVNTAEGQKRQALATSIAEENFFGTLGHSDLTVYTGHARGGGGPDFTPPVLKEDGTADYNGYYRVKKPGLKKLVSALQSHSSKPSLMAIIACKSDDLFRAPVQQAAPGTGWIATSGLIYFEDSFIATYLVLDGFLKQECGSTFQKTLQGLQTTNGASMVMDGFLGF
jgi:hypothetical protein